MKRLLIFVVFVLLILQIPVCAQAESVVQRLQEIAESAKQETERIKELKNSAQSETSESDESFPDFLNAEPIKFTGTGDDLVLANIDQKEYPYLYFKCRTANFFSVRISDEEGEDQSVISEIGAYEGLNYIGEAYIDRISMIEISGAKDWELIFLPKINRLVNKYSAPIAISGFGPAVFEVDGLGLIAEVELSSDGFSSIRQYAENSMWSSIASEAGEYSGKVKTKKDYPIISIETDSAWNISFYSQDGIKPENSIEYSFSPIIQAKQQNDPDNSDATNAESEIIPASVGTTVNCGDSFQFKYFYQPILTKSQSYQTAVGKFLMFRVHITNVTPTVISGLDDDSFKLHGDFNGVSQAFKLDGGASYSTSYRWDIAGIGDDYEPGIPLDTYLVFDVTGNATSWYLEFVPKSGTKKYCSVNIGVPKINVMD